MTEDQAHTAHPEPDEGSREEYVAPALTDLGSFEELTALHAGPRADLEGFS
jgi:hypothetical protein